MRDSAATRAGGRCVERRESPQNLGRSTREGQRRKVENFMMQILDVGCGRMLGVGKVTKIAAQDVSSEDGDAARVLGTEDWLAFAAAPARVAAHVSGSGVRRAGAVRTFDPCFHNVPEGASGRSTAACRSDVMSASLCCMLRISACSMAARPPGCAQTRRQGTTR
eukprot:6207848-Pleurochrysis_carterae.AAC.4